MLRYLISGVFFLLTSFYCGGPARALTAEQLSDWTQSYYLAPAPDDIPHAITLMRAKSYLSQAQTAAPLTGSLSGVFERYPDRLKSWLGELDQFTEAEQRTVLQAVWLSGTPQASRFLREIGTARLNALFRRDLSQPPAKSPDKFQVRNPGDLDFLWGRFFASGDREPLRNIISALPLRNVKREVAPSKIDALPTVTGIAAQWSLTSNASRYDRVLEICRAELQSASGDTADLLAGVVAKAEERRKQSGKKVL